MKESEKNRIGSDHGSIRFNNDDGYFLCKVNAREEDDEDEPIGGSFEDGYAEALGRT
jgi:hypothetical protein